MKRLFFEISTAAYEFLLTLKDGRRVEYRDNSYATVTAFLESDRYLSKYMTIEQYKARNENGTLYLVHELLKYGLVEDDEDAWHATYRISDLGHEILVANED